MLIKYQAMLIAAIVFIVHFTIYWKIITLVAMVALALIAVPVLHDGQDFLLDIIKEN